MTALPDIFRLCGGGTKDHFPSWPQNIRCRACHKSASEKKKPHQNKFVAWDVDLQKTGKTAVSGLQTHFDRPLSPLFAPVTPFNLVMDANSPSGHNQSFFWNVMAPNPCGERIFWVADTFFFGFGRISISPLHFLTNSFSPFFFFLRRIPSKLSRICLGRLGKKMFMIQKFLARWPTDPSFPTFFGRII